MIISQNLFFFILGMIVLAIFMKPLYMHFVKKQKQKGNIYDAIRFLLLIALLPFNWYTPRILTIADCGNYKQEVALFPVRKNGVKMGYGKKTYIFNNSAKKLNFEYHYYGNNSPVDGENNAVIQPNESIKVNTISIDYLFEEPEKSVVSKAGGETKTSLSCE
jgi:hypothetical protein